MHSAKIEIINDEYKLPADQKLNAEKYTQKERLFSFKIFAE